MTLSNPAARAAPTTPATLRDVARFYAAHPSEWGLAPRFDAQHRWYHRVRFDADMEVWLLSWLPGQGTEWHDHGGSSGAFAVAEGALWEDTVIGARELRAGTGRGFGPRHVHRVRNLGDIPAVSVHVYTPALTAMTTYELVDGVLRPLGVESRDQW